MNDLISIAIDGPAGAGKSTIAKTIAKDFGFIYVDTGALYRAIGYYVLKSGKTLSEKDVLSVLNEINVQLEFINFQQHVILNNEDISDKIRTPEVSMAASKVSAIGKVRDFLFDLQREFAKTKNVIMDGRDIGTVVLPDATIKIFLTASDFARAKRRYDELVQKDMNVSFDEVLNDLKVRDFNDSNREIAPLKPAKDSIIVDTTDLDLQQSIKKISDIIKNKLNRG